ncbi:hypothetical protein GGF31_005062 [Allomyces arbusculus]|nr:hypothetical protein GGF31_005062 [Allomyces arbusculus]
MHAVEFLAPSAAWAAVKVTVAAGTEFPDGSVMAKTCRETSPAVLPGALAQTEKEGDPRRGATRGG